MSNELGIPLQTFARGKTQPELAAIIGVSQSAVSQMMKSGRDIRVRVDGERVVQVFEIRPVGPRGKRAA